MSCEWDLQREAVYHVAQLAAAGTELRRADGVLAAVDVDRSAVDRIAGGIAQVGVRATRRFVAPPAQRVAGAQVRREIVGDLGLQVILHRVHLVRVAEDEPVLVAGIAARHCARHGRARRAVRARTHELVGEGDGLSVAVEVIETQPPGKFSRLVTHRGAGRPAGVAVARAVDLEVLSEGRNAGVHLELGRHARDVVDDGADRVARVCGGKGAIQHVDALDLLGRHEAPARREARAIAQQVRQQDAVGIHE